MKRLGARTTWVAICSYCLDLDPVDAKRLASLSTMRLLLERLSLESNGGSRIANLYFHPGHGQVNVKDDSSG